MSCSFNDMLGAREIIQAEGVADALESGDGSWLVQHEEQECEGSWGQDEVRGQGSKAPKRIGGRWVRGWISLVPQEPRCTG